jgi:hypothetical protein
MWMLARMVLLTLILASAASAQTIDLRMGPGESRDFSLSITNVAATTIHPVAIYPGLIGYPNPGLYLTYAAAPPCWVDDPGEIEAPPLAPGDTVQCQITVTRGVAAPVVGGTFVLGASPVGAIRLTPTGFSIGDFSELSFELVPVQPLPILGATSQLFRVTATSSSISQVTGATIESTYFPEPIRIDSNVPGGCTETWGLHMVDFPGTSSHGFQLPLIPAGGHSSCLIRLTALAGVSASTRREYYAFAGSTEDGFEMVATNAGSLPLLVVGATVARPPIPSLSVLGAAILGAAILMLFAFERRRRSTQQ